MKLVAKSSTIFLPLLNDETAALRLIYKNTAGSLWPSIKCSFIFTTYLNKYCWHPCLHSLSSAIAIFNSSGITGHSYVIFAPASTAKFAVSTVFPFLFSMERYRRFLSLVIELKEREWHAHCINRIRNNIIQTFFCSIYFQISFIYIKKF